MNTVNFLRVAFVVVLIQYTAHAILFLSAKPLHGQDEAALIEAMKLHRWNFSGFKRSYWNFYFGYGLVAILLGLVEAAILWQISKYAKMSSLEVKPMIAILFFANILHAILTLRYFFLLPALFDFIVAIFLALAFMFAM